MAIQKLVSDVEQYLKWAGSGGTTQQEYQDFVRNIYNLISNITGCLTLWQPETNYTKGTIVKSPSMPSNVIARVNSNGTTGKTEPVWTVLGTTVKDGTLSYSMIAESMDYATQKEVTAGVDNKKIVTSAMLGQTIQTDLESNENAEINGTSKNVKCGVTGILTEEHGGTGAKSLDSITAGASKSLVGDYSLFDYLHRKGDNFVPPADNIVINALGIFAAQYNKNGTFPKQPTTYGQLISIPFKKGTGGVNQFWIEHGGGRLYHRGTFGDDITQQSFSKFLDSSDLSDIEKKLNDIRLEIKRSTYPTKFAENELTILFNQNIGTGTITLSQPYTNFDGLYIVYSNDDNSYRGTSYISVWELQNRMKLAKEDDKTGVVLFSGNDYWIITTASTTTNLFYQKENCRVHKVFGVKFK